MSTFDDRLRALDPFAGAPYDHADAAGMIERITTATPARPHRRRLAVLLAPMTVVAAAGLATGLLVTAGTTAPSLSAIHVMGGHRPAATGAPLGLTFAENGSSYATSLSQYAGPVPTTLFEPDAAPPASTNLYVESGQLATSTPTLAAYQVLSPASPTGVLAASATTLHVNGTVKRVATSAWRLGTVANLHGVAVASVYRSPSGIYDFQYLRGDLVRLSMRCPSSATSGVVDTDRLSMSVTVANLLASLGLRYELATPTYQTSWSRAGRAGCTGIVARDATILVSGVATDQVVQAAFDPQGRLVAASFPVFMLGRPASYPLVSAAAAADALARTSAGLRAVVDARPSASTTTAGGAHTYLDGVPRNLMIVELRTSSIALRAFVTTTGATWLLPVYALSGDGYTDVAASPTVWSGDVVATAAPLVRIVGTSVNQARIFDERRLGTLP